MLTPLQDPRELRVEPGTRQEVIKVVWQWWERRTQTPEVLRKPTRKPMKSMVMAKMSGMGKKAEAALRSNWGGVCNTTPSSQKPYLNTEQLNCWPCEDDYTHLFPFHFLKPEIPNLLPYPGPCQWQHQLQMTSQSPSMGAFTVTQ